MSGAAIDAALAAIEEMGDEIVEHLVAAVRTQSVNPAYPIDGDEDLLGGEADMARLLEPLQVEAGLTVDRFAIEPGRENCVGHLAGKGGGRSLVLNGHVDVVPVGDPDEWSVDPFGGEVCDGCVWGRGSSDMKSGVIAQTCAAIALRRARVKLRGDLTLAAVAAEETGQHELGTTATIERGYRGDAAVVAEPSAPPVPLAVVPVTPGLLWFTLSVQGRATHASLRGEVTRPNGAGASLGVDAFEHGLLLVQALKRLDEEWGQSKRHPLFKDGHFVLQPAVVTSRAKGTEAPLFVPDTFTARYNVTHHPDEDPETVKAEIERQVRTAAQLDPWLREQPPTISWDVIYPAAKLDLDHALCDEVVAAHDLANQGKMPPAQIRGFAAVADVTWYREAGIPALIYGPGDIRWAHAANERVAIEEVLAATRTFAVLAIRWCGV